MKTLHFICKKRDRYCVKRYTSFARSRSSLGNFWPCVKISVNLTNIKSATQLRKFGLFPVYLAARVVFFMHEWFDSHPSNHSCMKSFVREKNYANCEVNGKKSKFTQLRGGLNVRQIFWNFNAWSKITRINEWINGNSNWILNPSFMFVQAIQNETSTKRSHFLRD